MGSVPNLKSHTGWNKPGLEQRTKRTSSISQVGIHSRITGLETEF